MGLWPKGEAEMQIKRPCINIRGNGDMVTGTQILAEQKRWKAERVEIVAKLTKRVETNIQKTGKIFLSKVREKR